MNAKEKQAEKTPSAWSQEMERTGKLFDQWLDYRLNRFFDLSVHGPGYRSIRIFFLRASILVPVFLIQIFFFSFLTQVNSQSTTLPSLGLIAALTFFRLLFILLIPVYIAINMAGNYITDVFELKDPAVAWKFIREISLSGASEVLHIRDGKIAEEDKDSPIVLIGGPGRLEVEFDSVVLFEKPNGTPHVIGPADMKSEEEKKKKGRDNKKNEQDPAVLEGFERLREPIINLRDQYFGNTASDAITVESRSLDGLQVSASDVRVVFSIHQSDGSDPQKLDKERPYHYDPQSVQTLIYQQPVQVLQKSNPSGEPGGWTGTMRGLVSGSIADFMSQNKLAEYLASISTPELEAQAYREDTILLQTMQYSSQLPAAAPDNMVKPKFHPRTELSDRFMKYTDGFSKRAAERGIDLHWIGVGTWKIPNEISGDVINGRHLEAWRISRENAIRSGDNVLNSILDEACLNEKLRLIQEVPFAAYQKEQAKYTEKEKIIEALLWDFWEQLGDALDDYYKNNTRNQEVDKLERAILKIEKLLDIPGGAHMVGGGTFSKVKSRVHSADDTPPAPSSRSEDQQYRILLTKLDGNYKVAEGMIANEQRRFPDLTREEAIVRIVKRLERYGK
jgi:hypothetical protein